MIANSEYVANTFGNCNTSNYQQSKVEGHLGVCGNREFRIFHLLQMRSQNRNLGRSYETKFQ